jgi:hypothetical protein
MPGTRVAADMGGAAGVLLLRSWRRTPNSRRVLLDRPGVIPAAVAAAERVRPSPPLSAIAGDFFTAVPKADLYLLKHILHDWDDAGCIRILTNCGAP